MPRIRDFAYSYNTSIIATSITCDVPYWEDGDILVAILTTDKDTQTWTSSGWTQYVSGTSTVNTGVMWRVASGVGATATFTYTTAETANATIISIEDAHLTTPFTHSNATAISTANQLVASTTPTTDNNLLLWITTNSGTAVIPSVIEGSTIQMISKDGNAHSDCISWSYNPFAGNQGNIATTSVSGTTYTGRCTTLAIQPPATGATVIPTYCVADASKYIDPLHGLTAFRGNSAPDGTATTYFGTTLKSLTLANGTASAKVDYGINSFRSCLGFTGPTTKSWTGAALSLAAGNVLTTHAGKNILAHAMPLIPADIQTVHNIGSGLGVAMGMYTSANNFKVWHVHGAGSAWGVNRTPVVINTSNTSGVIQTTGTLNPSSIAGFGFFTSGFSVSSDWVWSMIWALDTCTVAGGSIATPVDISGIRIAVADGHERMSAIQNGSSQLLLLQPVQFGDGGSHPIYMDLSSTAIEFPQQYNRAEKSTFYCGADNVVGLTYYAGATDTVIQANAVVSSKSPFHWRIHESSSTSATYDFSGLAIIGAGDVQLRAVTTFDSMSFTSCSNIQHNSALITNSTFTGSYIYSNALGNISGCNFISSGTGHAIEVSVAGTYAFTGNTFSGYGANGTTDAAIYNKSGGVVTIDISGGGDTPTVRNGVGSSTTVINTINLTLTGLKDGSDIVILQAGTESQLADIQSNRSGTSYVYKYSTQQSIDIGVFKEGYVPFYIRGYSLGATDASLPIAQVVDRNFA